jgi:Leucine-rich repeat (LRR) protein
MRTLLIVVTAFCVFLGLFMWPSLRHKAYQAKWRELGIFVNEDASCDEEVFELHYDGSYNAANQPLTVFPAKIGNLKNLTRLSVFSNELTELPIELGNLTNLMVLEIGGTQLAMLPREIGKLTNLESMRVNAPQLIEWPAEIGNLTKLKRMELTPMTDADLVHLKPLKRLEYLGIANTRVTKTGIADLKKSLPNCKIERPYGLH